MKRLCLVFPIILLLVFSIGTPFTCYALSDVDYVLDVPEPPVDVFNGYLFVPYYNPSYDEFYYNLVWWHITPTGYTSSDSVPVVNVSYSSSSGKNIYIESFTSDSDSTFAITFYNYSSSQGLYADTQYINHTDMASFRLSYGSNIELITPRGYGYIWTDESSGLNSYNYSYSITWGDLNDIYTVLNGCYDYLSDLYQQDLVRYNQLLELHSLLDEYLNKLKISTDNVYYELNWFKEEFLNWTIIEEDYYIQIIDRLDSLINGTEEYTESSTLSDEQNELNRVEDELLNNEAASSAQEDIKVEINANAMSYIWDLITQFLQSNSKVFGLVISVLSLGIIALILNR